VEAGLFCIFIKPHILNEAMVSSYIQDILKHGKKTFKSVILVIRDEF